MALGKKIPGKINFGSAGYGTTHHMNGELFNLITGTKLTHVPFKGAGPLTPALLSGEVDMAFDGMGTAAPNIKAGKLRALAVTPAKRLDVFPDVPSVGEFLPGYEATGFAGIGAPKATPVEIIDLLNKALNAGLADPKIKARIEELGGTVTGGSPGFLGKGGSRREPKGQPGWRPPFR